MAPVLNSQEASMLSNQEACCLDKYIVHKNVFLIIFYVLDTSLNFQLNALLTVTIM